MEQCGRYITFTYINTKMCVCMYVCVCVFVCVCVCVHVILGNLESDWDTLLHKVSF